MTTKYLLHYVHEHVPFRWPEFLALTSKNNCRFNLVSNPEHISSRPYIIIELNDGTTQKSLTASAKSSYLLKGLYELWASSSESLDDLSDKASKSPLFISGQFSMPEQSFRVDCESFRRKLAQSTKNEWIRKMKLFETFQSKPNLSYPEQSYCIFEIDRDDESLVEASGRKEYHFGRLLTYGSRNLISNFSLKERIFIANTSMDPALSFISANAAKVGENDIVFDPFVGSGSLLVAAAHLGAYVIGADIDWLLLHGKSRPTRAGQKIRSEGESVRANLYQYNLEKRYIDVMISDITRSPLHDAIKFDAIVTDPPYGVRECSEKIGARHDPRPVKNDLGVRFPAKTVYSMGELLIDLLNLSAKHLKITGRLVYYLPIVLNESSYEEFIPKHPCLELISFSEQIFSAKSGRLMVVMEKIRDLEPSDKVHIPRLIDEMKFRDTFFGLVRDPAKENSI